MTKIEWTHRPGTKGETWNPIVGCSITSPGCTNCYAMSMAARIERMTPGSHYAGTTKPSKAGPVWTGKVVLAPEHIMTAPLRATKPRTYFVNSMGDLFHEDVPITWIERVFAVMALCPQHTFIVLTKSSALMFDFISHADEGDTLDAIATEAAQLTGSPCAAATVKDAGWPLPNVWLGVSTERQQEADERIPHLLATPAAVRFISAEPLLGPINLTNPISHDAVGVSHRGYLSNKVEPDDYQFHSPKIDWVIVGGESGPGARPMHPDWARSLRDQCTEAGVPFFFKQWGEWLFSNDDQNYAAAEEWRRLHFPTAHAECFSSGHTALKVGKTRAGRTLDGREHTEWPSAAPAEKESV